MSITGFATVQLVFVCCVLSASAVVADDGPSQKTQRVHVLKFLTQHVLGKELAEPLENLVLKEGELEAETQVTRKITNLVETPHGFQFDMLSNRKQTNFDLGPDGKRTGKSYVKDSISVARRRVGERLSTGELIGISDNYYSSNDDYPYSPMSLKMWMQDGVLVVERESIHYQDLYAQENRWGPGIIQVREEYSLVDGKVQQKFIERGIDLDVKTGKRTTQQPDLITVATEREQAATAPDTSSRESALESMAKRANGLFFGESGRTLVRIEKTTDPATIKKRVLPFLTPFEKTDDGNYEQHTKLTVIATGIEGKSDEEIADLITQLDTTAGADGESTVEIMELITRLTVRDGKVLISETVLDEEGKQPREEFYDIEPLGAHGIRTKLRRQDVAKAEQGAWVSCDWRLTEEGKLEGIRRYKDTDTIVKWVEATDAGNRR